MAFINSPKDARPLSFKAARDHALRLQIRNKLRLRPSIIVKVKSIHREGGGVGEGKVACYGKPLGKMLWQFSLHSVRWPRARGRLGLAYKSKH